MFDEVLLQQRLGAFRPEPLIAETETTDEILEIPMVREDEDNIDLAKANYLDVLNDGEIKRAAEDLIRKYGVGTCGPRAFYGTTDVHLELEERLAEFLRTEESIVYSYGFVAISSSIAAYCKRSDVVFVDEKANFPIRQGLTAARSTVVTFAHNDPRSLRALVTRRAETEKRKSRKFLIIEGVSWATGKLCPLPDFLQIAEEFKMRVFLEESHSVGVYGDTGRGLTEHFDVDPSRVDMIVGTLEGAIGSIGGFCAGSNLIIEHQRLSGSGYIFSASLPTYLVKVVLKSLEMMGDSPRRLAALAGEFHEFLARHYAVESHPESAFKVFSTGRKDGDAQVYRFCRGKGVHFLEKDEGLMVNLNVKLLDDRQRLRRVYEVLEEAASEAMKAP